MEMPKCVICLGDKEKKVYDGDIRNGPMGTYCFGEINKCENCGIVRLSEKYCLVENDYIEQDYRLSLNQSYDLKEYEEEHRSAHQKLHEQFSLEDVNFNKKILIDVGCGGGSFLNQYYDEAEEIILIEPDKEFQSLLKKAGRDVFPSISDFIKITSKKADFVILNQVIEHVDDPIGLLRECSDLLADTGYLIVTTPNLDDVLNKVGCARFMKHFYRVQHRWYFNLETLNMVAARASLAVDVSRTYHRYDFSNFMKWMGMEYSGGNLNQLNDFWRCAVEKNGNGDNLFALLRKIT